MNYPVGAARLGDLRVTLRKHFAQNLLRLCAEKESIAAVCRGTKINRQQFNRYLSGASLPNAGNLAKICRYFDIDETELFGPVFEDASPQVKNALTEQLMTPRGVVDAAMELLTSEGQSSVKPGYYYVDFAHPHDANSLMRSVLIIRAENGIMTFRRLTGRAEKKGSWWSHYRGDHRGIVLERRHWMYFVGLNSVGNTEPTLLVLRWVPNSDPILSGHATILTPIGPTVTAAVVTPCPPETTLRQAISASHVYAMDSAELDPIITEVLEQQCETLVSMVQKLDLRVRPIEDAVDKAS